MPHSVLDSQSIPFRAPLWMPQRCLVLKVYRSARLCGCHIPCLILKVYWSARRFLMPHAVFDTQSIPLRAPLWMPHAVFDIQSVPLRARPCGCRMPCLKFKLYLPCLIFNSRGCQCSSHPVCITIRENNMRCKPISAKPEAHANE